VSHRSPRKYLRGVLSLWTRTPIFRVERGPLVVQTLAVALAAQAFKETEFVTDSGGALLASTLGWQFSQVVTPLDKFATEGIEHVWALGKLAACSIQDEPFVQFDGDVLLFKPLPHRLCSARLIAQSPDPDYFYASADMRRALKISGLPRGHTAYNAGLIGGRDVALVRAYAFAAMDLARRFRNCGINGTTTSMLIEQYHFGVFAARTRVPVSTLLPVRPKNSQVKRAGYAHLAGSAKRSSVYVSKAEMRLHRDFPDAYERFLSGWRKVSALTAPAGREPNCNFEDDSAGGEFLHYLQGTCASRSDDTPKNPRKSSAGRRGRSA